MACSRFGLPAAPRSTLLPRLWYSQGNGLSDVIFLLCIRRRKLRQLALAADRSSASALNPCGSTESSRPNPWRIATLHASNSRQTTSTESARAKAWLSGRRAKSRIGSSRHSPGSIARQCAMNSGAT